MTRRTIYLDYAAATPMDPQVATAMEPFFADEFYNPSSSYLAAQRARRQLEAARASVARSMGCRASEVIFTAGATEANNLAIQGIMRRYSGKKLITSSIEHDSVLAPAGLFKNTPIPVSTDGIVDLKWLAANIDGDTVLVSVGLVNNELGSIQPIREIGKIMKEVKARRGKELPLYLHTDAAQAPNFIDINPSKLGVDLLSLGGGKMYGPKQSGILYIKTGVKLEPIIYGGGQEFGLRSGTENVAAAVGLAKAYELARDLRAADTKKTRNLRQLFIKLLAAQVPLAAVNDSSRSAAPHIVSLTIPGQDNERLMMELDEAGIECAVGSACSASSARPSHVLEAIGLPERLIRSTLRFSLGRYTTEQEIKKTVKTLAELTSGNR